jgi:hypothetical protein
VYGSLLLERWFIAFGIEVLHGWIHGAKWLEFANAYSS